MGTRRRLGLAGTGAALLLWVPTAPGATAGALPASTTSVTGPAEAALASRAAFTLTLQARPVNGLRQPAVHGSGAFDFAAGRGEAAVAQSAGRERLVFLPDSVYVREAGMGGLLPGGKSWLSAGLTEDVLSTNFPQFVTQVESLSPLLVLSEVAWGTSAAAASPAVAGTTRFRVSVDLAAAAAHATGPAGAALSRAIGFQVAGAGASGTVEVDVWVSAGRVTRLASSPPDSGMGTITMTLSHFGRSVSVAAPPAATVVDVASLSPEGERENTGGGDSDGA